MRFFRPTAARILLLSIFLVIAFFGSREAEAFGDGDGHAASAVPVWTVWMVLLAPLGIVLLVLETTGMPFQRAVFGGMLLFWIVQVVYFYVIACAVAAVGSRLRRR